MTKDFYYVILSIKKFGQMCRKGKDMRTMNRFDYLNIERYTLALPSSQDWKGFILLHPLEIGQVRGNCLYNYRHS